MLIRRGDLEKIRDGSSTVLFRRWRRPSVRTGGTLKTAVGELLIKDVSVSSTDDISPRDANRAGYPSREALLTELNRRSTGQVYRIELGGIRPDPRVELREREVTGEPEIKRLVTELTELDRRSGSPPWTIQTLRLLGANPGMPARELCQLMTQEKKQFKRNVRKLKALGLTESLSTGYRLSARGASLLNAIGGGAAQKDIQLG